MRQGEDDVDVVHREKLRESGVEPPLIGEGLALRAVAVAAGAPDKTLLAAVGAHLAMSSEGRGAAALDGAQGGELLAGQSSGGAKTIAVSPDDVRELEPTPSPAMSAGRRPGQTLGPGAVQQVERRRDRRESPLTEVEVAHRRGDGAVTE